MNAKSSSQKRIKQNLVALGSAAVLTVYSVGYARTRTAAARFEEADGADRRRPAPVPSTGEIGAASPLTAAAAAERADAAPAHTVEREPHERGASDHATSTHDAGSARASHDSAHASATAAGVDTTVKGVAVPRSPGPPVPSTAAHVADSVVATKSAADSVAARETAQVAADSAASARGQFKDGTYYGWGTSRHGDIQAGVEIKNGKITDAWVSQCLTRYSCSWIANLPYQVVSRQSPEVDFVSGATQSTNAFYYAVVQALTRAK